MPEEKVETVEEVAPAAEAVEEEVAVKKPKSKKTAPKKAAPSPEAVVEPPAVKRKEEVVPRVSDRRRN